MGCEGEEGKYSWKDVIPPWQMSVAENLGGLVEDRLGQPATGYPGPMMTGMDPLLTAGAGALMGMQGQGYTPPEYMGYEEQGFGTPGMPGWNTLGPSWMTEDPGVYNPTPDNDPRPGPRPMEEVPWWMMMG